MAHNMTDHITITQIVYNDQYFKNKIVIIYFSGLKTQFGSTVTSTKNFPNISRPYWFLKGFYATYGSYDTHNPV